MNPAFVELRALNGALDLGGDENSARLRACLRFVDGVPTADDIAWMGSAIAAFLSSDGGLPLERCMRLPATHSGWRRLQRDMWLCKAAALLDVCGSWGGAQELAKEWATFLSRGPWKAWRDDEAPPDYATPLNAALFYASRYNRSDSLDAKQLYRIVGHIFKEKSL